MPFEKMFNNFLGHEVLIFVVKMSYYYQDYIQPLNEIPVITRTGSANRMNDFSENTLSLVLMDILSLKRKQFIMTNLT